VSVIVHNTSAFPLDASRAMLHFRARRDSIRGDSGANEKWPTQVRFWRKHSESDHEPDWSRERAARAVELGGVVVVVVVVASSSSS